MKAFVSFFVFRKLRKVRGVMGKLEGKVAVITGASKGIGEGIAKVYAKYGAKCVLAARGPKVLELAEQLKSEGYEATGVQVDVSDYKSVEKLVEVAENTYGKIDVLVCNAGVCVLEDFLEDDTFENRDLHDEELEKCMECGKSCYSKHDSKWWWCNRSYKLCNRRYGC